MSEPRGMAEVVKDLDRRRENISMIARRLFRLSQAFYVTGNETLSVKLEQDALYLQEIESALCNISGDITGLYVSGAEQAHANMLNAALAGVTIASKEQLLGHARGCNGQNCVGECARSPCPHGNQAFRCGECTP